MGLDDMAAPIFCIQVPPRCVSFRTKILVDKLPGILHFVTRDERYAEVHVPVYSVALDRGVTRH
ncbi:MAG: hypothetical protein ONB14_09560 [candidate division KSB1 bacterium]|nr:hypothetical protein [candidate division KSB1 bacterium]MDZ7379570.1 hypothetical protein [candidate division KSB1 bacterium]